MELPEKITAEYIPPPPVPPVVGKVKVTPPADSLGYPAFPVLHLSISHAYELYEELKRVLEEITHGTR